MADNRTIDEIYGAYGLTKDSTSDPFAKSEQAIMDQTRTFLKERASIRQEQDAAKGFGRSSYSDAAAFKEEEGILANIYSQFAQQRTAEDLKKTQFDRDIVGAGAASDIQKEQIKAQSDAQIAAIQEQGNVEYGVGTSGTQAKKEIIQEQAKVEYGIDPITQEVNSKFSSEKALLQEKQRLGELTAQQAFEQQMGSYELNEDGTRKLDEEGNPIFNEGLIAREYSEKSDLIKKEYEEGRISAQDVYRREVSGWTDDDGTVHQGLIDAKYDAEKKLISDNMQAEMDKLFGKTDNPPVWVDGKLQEGTGGEIAQRYYYSKQLEIATLEYKKDVAKVDAESRVEAAKIAAGVDLASDLLDAATNKGV